jgi:hypothetical protein
MTKSEMEKRLIAVEKEVADLKAANVASKPAHPLEFLDSIHGTFQDDEAFRKAARIGRKWRESFRPKSAKSTAKRK